MSLTKFLELLGTLVAALGGGLGLSYLAPPSDDPAVVRLILLALAAGVWILAWLATRQWEHQFNPRRRYRRLLAVTSLSLLAFVAFGVTYLLLREQWTVNYLDTKVLVGSKLTPVGEIYFDNEPTATAQQAVLDNAGDAETIWTEASITKRRLIAWSLHVPSFGLAVFLIIFAWYLLKAELAGDRRGSGPGQPPGST